MVTDIRKTKGMVTKAQVLDNHSRDKIVHYLVDALKPYPRNARTHSKKQIRQIADSITRFGFTNPVLIDDEAMIMAGHGRVLAAKLLGMSTVPTLALSHLSAEDRRAYILADNKLAANAGWDQELLAHELQFLLESDYDVELTGFSLSEIDFTIEAALAADPNGRDAAEDIVPELGAYATTRPGDVWQMGPHRLICGDAQDKTVFEKVLTDASGTVETVGLVFTDPTYNVKIDGNATGLGAIKHREFAFASGEMSVDQFTRFLTTTLGHCAAHLRDGAIAFVCMDWRHMRELLDAGDAVFTEFKNLVVWNKTNGGMGAFYRSKHEHIFVFKSGTAPHINSFGLGGDGLGGKSASGQNTGQNTENGHGRYRTNVWDYAGISSISTTRSQDLAMHPTVKPVAMIADAIKDCSKRGNIVLDCFGGSGSTLIAAHKTGRSARLIEYDPLYCDTIVGRWERFTGKQAVLVGQDMSFEDVAAQRRGLEAVL
jgi:DNA modification methylase